MKSALIRLHTAVFLWGFTGVLGRAISLNEGWLVWWRMFITVISLWILFYFLKSEDIILLIILFSLSDIDISDTVY